MSEEILPDSSSMENKISDEQEEIPTMNVEEKSSTATVPELDEVQSFCAEFHIKVENAAGIRPWLQFSDTNFPEEVLKQFEESEFDMPTPIQSIAWPILGQNRDLVGIASTGSGKTLAFVLPLVFHIRNQPPLQPDDGPIAIVLAPTRELVQQIHSVAQPYFNLFGIKSLCIIGGDEREKQINEIGDGKEVYICTPGRLADFLEAKITTLYRVTCIVLDEADKMLDLGFETQVRNILADFKTPKTSDNEEQQTRRQAQIAMFSATWPKSIKALAEDYLTNYVHATVGCLSESHAVNLHIRQIVDFCPNEQQKKEKLFKILDEVCGYASERKAIIFVRTRDKVNRLSKDLEQNGYKALLLHGSKSQQIRNEVLKEFRDTPNALLLATDVASRGLDVDDVRFVINYDFPTSDAVYIHRIGRTGRNSRHGTAFTFFSNEDAKHAPALIHILDEAGATVHPVLLQIGRKNGFNKWVANVGIPQYPVYNPDDNWSDRNNDQDWSNDDYYNQEDLPPNLMGIDLSSFDPSQLRPTPVPLLSSNGQLNELDVSTRTKNFQDYKQRCQLLERLSWEHNEGNYSNNQNDYNNYDNYNYNNNHNHNRYNAGWSNPGSENPNGRNWNSNQNEWQNKNFDSSHKRSWDNHMPPSNNHQWNGPNNNNNNNNNLNNGQTNYDQWKSSNQSQHLPPPPQQHHHHHHQHHQQQQHQQQQQQQQLPSQQDQQLSDLETNPAILYAKASSEYHIQYNQYTTALQQAMAAQQAGTPITPQQQQYLITFQQQLQAKQQQLQVMQQAANLQQATILQAAALSAATQNAWNQQTNPSSDPSKSTTDAQQNWMQQWMNAGYDASQMAAYQQWYAQMQAAASLATSAALSQPQTASNPYNGMLNSNQQSAATISAPPTVSSSTANAAQRAYAAYSNRTS